MSNTENNKASSIIEEGETKKTDNTEINNQNGVDVSTIESKEQVTPNTTTNVIEDDNKEKDTEKEKEVDPSSSSSSSSSVTEKAIDQDETVGFDPLLLNAVIN
eukprot:Awhi_evm1s404